MAITVNFTKEYIQSLATPQVRTEYADGGGRSSVKGLRLRVTPTGTKTFSVLKRIKDGDPERITLGRFPDLTVEQARRKAIGVLSIIAEGDNPAAIKRKIKGEKTFSEMFEDYLARHAKPKKRTWKTDQDQYRVHLKDTIGNMKLSRITTKTVRALHEKLTNAGHSTNANRLLSLISIVFEKAISWEEAESNPTKGIERNKEKSRDRFLLSDELPRFFASLAADESPNMKDFFLLALLTGARRSNVAAMEWRHISFERSEWRIELTKNGDPQIVALSPEAIQILLDRKNGATSKFVFPSKSKSGHLEEEKYAWRRILDRDELLELIKRLEQAGHHFEIPADEYLSRSLTRAREMATALKINTDGTRLENLRVHDLRRTLGSWQAASGASLAIIGKSLNQKSVQSTAIYARLQLDPVRESINRATSNMMATYAAKENVLPFKKKTA